MKLNINGKLGCGTVKAWQTDNIKIDLEMRQCSDSLRCGNMEEKRERSSVQLQQHRGGIRCGSVIDIGTTCGGVVMWLCGRGKVSAPCAVTAVYKKTKGTWAQKKTTRGSCGT